MKKPQSNKGPSLLPKSGSWQDYLEDESFMAFPGKAEWRKRLIFTLFHWLKNGDHVEIEDFYFEYEIPRTTFYRWCNEYEDIKRAVTEVKIFLGSRRRTGAIKNKFNYVAAYRDMQCYDPDWYKVDEYHNNLKIDVQKEAKADLINQGIPFVVTRCLGECSHKEEKAEDNE